MSDPIRVLNGLSIEVIKDRAPRIDLWVGPTSEFDDSADCVASLTQTQAYELAQALLRPFGLVADSEPATVNWVCIYTGMDGNRVVERYTNTPADEVKTRQAALRTFLEERGAHSISFETDDD